MSPQPRPRRYAALREVGLLLGYGLGAAFFTYPLLAGLSHWVPDLADPLLNSWALAWVIRELPRSPFGLFDANIFHPETGTLAFSENLLGIALLVAPVQWFWGRAVLTHNVALLISIALSGYGAYRLTRWSTGSTTAAMVGGSLFAFVPYRLGHLSHLQLQATGFLPLVLLCIGRYLETGRARHVVGVGVFLWLLSASCGYYGVFTWILLGVAVPWEVVRCRALRRKNRVPGLALALVLSAAAFVPLARPYMRLERDFGFARPLERVERASARPASYLSSGSPMHRVMGLESAHAEQMLFPGVTAIVLGTLGLFTMNRRSGLYLVLGVTAFWASLGPSAGLYAWLHRLVPGVSGLRVPARFSVFVFLAVAVLGAGAANAALGRLGKRKAWFGAFLLAVLPLLESVGRPLHLRPAPVGPHEVYVWLSRQPRPSPVVELPMPRSRETVHENALYMLWSTEHFQPIANGYSAFVPPSFYELSEAADDFTSNEFVTLLRRRAFRYVILHRDLYLRHLADQVEQDLNRAVGLRKLHRTRYETVYEVTPEAE